MNDPEITVTLPPVYLPHPLETHPEVKKLEQEGLAFMERHGFLVDSVLRTRVISTNTAEFFGNLCPRADAGRLQMAVDWGYLMFVFDDLHCDGDNGGDNFAFLDLTVRFVRTLETPTGDVLDARHPFSAPVLELARRLHQMASPTQIRRLIDSHLYWFLGVAWEIPALQRRAAWGLNDFIFTRLMNAAAAPTLAWFLVSESDDIADAELNAPAVRALTEMVGAVATVDDDLYSFGKEQWLTRHQHGAAAFASSSLINTYVAQQRLTEQQALQACVELRDRITARFFELRARVLPTASPALARYLANLTSLLHGNFAWGVVAGRYTNPDGCHPGAVRVLGSLSSTPAATGAPGIPSIDGWWAV